MHANKHCGYVMANASLFVKSKSAGRLEGSLEIVPPAFVGGCGVVKASGEQNMLTSIQPVSASKASCIPPYTQFIAPKHILSHASPLCFWERSVRSDTAAAKPEEAR